MSAIFLKQGDSLAEMIETEYEAEDVLQKLLADYPGLLAGDRDDEDDRRWLLVRRELGIASEPDGSSRWSLDHLFIDQEGIPTLVEVKRSSDTRIRREVVGQMLDYAANGSHVWDQDTIRASYEGGREDPDEDLREFLRDRSDPDQFWGRVGTNLKAGRLRLVFVADQIPSELQRVIEFLNEQMTSTEVLAIEIKQYKERNGDRLTLVPRMIGLTEAARTVKGASPRAVGQWSESSFRDALEKKQPHDLAHRMNSLYDLLVERGAEIIMGTGKTEPSINLWFNRNGEDSTKSPLAVSFYLTGVAINLDFVRDRRSEEEMERLVRIIREIPGVAEYFAGLEQKVPAWGMRPTMNPRNVLQSDDAVKVFAEKLIEATIPN